MPQAREKKPTKSVSRTFRMREQASNRFNQLATVHGMKYIDLLDYLIHKEISSLLSKHNT